ncbi:MAG: hypothetical protein RBU45_17410 [Myxococcota bacterium]|jgi:hypothetical protein|nr:hypothetical protein [Myxococcota bacterium]
MIIRYVGLGTGVLGAVTLGTAVTFWVTDPGGSSLPAGTASGSPARASSSPSLAASLLPGPGSVGLQLRW